tara:strand:+ start:309 stop:1013 length:705 start_codon:yes stop_codon:yes gene_type:complete
MDKLKDPILSIIIPTINEAKSLPLLFADLNNFSMPFEIIISDAGSIDLTKEIAILNGAMLTINDEPNRGYQLKKGFDKSKGDWLLFIHADTRCSPDWDKGLSKVINCKESRSKIWFFDFKVNNSGFQFRLMEIFVLLRNKLLKTPYGDQGLLIHRDIYKGIGGYKPYHLMEDIDLIKRLSNIAEVKRLRLPIYVSSRKWEKINILRRGIRNLILRLEWSSGASTSSLYRKYYKS